MKVNIQIEVDEDDRNAIACALADKPVKRRATRRDIAAIVVGGFRATVDVARDRRRELAQDVLDGRRMTRPQVAASRMMTGNGFVVIGIDQAGHVFLRSERSGDVVGLTPLGRTFDGPAESSS